MTVSLSTQILFLTMASLSFISVNIFWEFAMLPDVYILLSPQEEEVHSSSWGNRCIHLAAHPSKILNLLSVIILVCFGNTQKTRLQYKLLRYWYSWCRLLIVIDELGHFINSFIKRLTVRGWIIQQKQVIQLCYGVCYDTK